jgi:Leucine-rich repeat (LRR) protein
MLTGSLPSEVALLQNLAELEVPNTMLQGTIPEELYAGATSLKRLNLDGCQFSGTIKTEIGLLTNLVSVKLANNNFHGSIPTELSALSSLVDIHLNGNNFTGSLPEGVCENLPAINYWEIVVDCAPNASSGIAPMTCKCCTACCDRDTRICQEQ